MTIEQKKRWRAKRGIHFSRIFQRRQIKRYRIIRRIEKLQKKLEEYG